MQIVEKKKQKIYALDAKEIEIDDIRGICSELSKKIIKAIVNKEKYPKQIAKELKENEQKIYYHIRNLEKAGIIKIARQETIHGTTAKFYRISEQAFVLKFSELIPTQEISAADEMVARFIHPFIEGGRINARIIVGSPDPHGPEKARSRDGHYGIDFALFFGTFLNYVPEIQTKLDTEATQEDLKENLVLIGGPIINRITDRFNKHLPVHFSPDRNIYSKISKTKYSSDEVGLIVKIRNPFNPEKSVLVIAGKRFSGTRAAVTAFLKNFREIYTGNKFKPNIMAKVVEGLDLDSDGIVDSVEFRE